VTGQQTRERIVRKGRARWVGAVHEVLVSQGRSGRASESLCVRQRARVGKAARVAYRDLKILLHEHKHGRLDPRGLFYLARELRPVYEAQAIKFYEEYLLKDTWIEQRILGRLALGRIYEQRANPEGYEAAFREYAAAVAEEPTPEGYFALARIAYYRKDWPSCVRHSEAGLALGDPQGRCPINPLERKHTPHIYYNVALHGVGRVQDAIASCKAALTIAETGHLAFATLHTNSTYESVNRIVDSFPQDQRTAILSQLAFVLEGVVCQQLVPHASGKGRVMICEVMVCTPAIKAVMREGKVHQIYGLMQAGQKYGMQTMNMALHAAIQKRKITVAEALDRSADPKELSDMMERGTAALATAGARR